MKLQEAIKITKEYDGKDCWFLKQCGMPFVREAIYTIFHRKNVNRNDLERAEAIQNRILRKY